MAAILCELCGSNDIIKQDGYFVCQHCGTRYTSDEARKMMIEGTVDVKGTVKVDNSAFVQKYLANAHRALNKEDWEEVEKYYNMVEQNAPNNMEAVFFSSFGKAMLSMTDSDYFKRQQQFKVLNNSISVINDYYELTTENKEEVLRKISDYIQKMCQANYVYSLSASFGKVGSSSWCANLLLSVKAAFLTELRQIAKDHDEAYIRELISKNTETTRTTSGGCYVATAVYGSYDCPQVWILRRYRDYTLARTWYGRVFIYTYYFVSPMLVKWFGSANWFKKMWQEKLDHMVDKLRSEGMKDTPYEDKKF